MISSLTALLVVFAAVIGSTAMMGIIAYFFHRLRQIEARTSGGAGSHEFADRLEVMQEELLTAQNEIAALAERLEFTEKLLMSGDAADAPGEPE